MFQELSTSTFSGLLCSSSHLDVFYYKTAALSTESMSCLLLLDSCFEPGEHELSELSSSSWQLLWARRAGAVFYFLTSALSKESKVSRSCLLHIDSCSEQGEQELSSTSWPLLLARRVRRTEAVYDLYNRRCPSTSFLASLFTMQSRRCLLSTIYTSEGVCSSDHREQEVLSTVYNILADPSELWLEEGAALTILTVQYFSQLNCWNCVLWWPLPLGQPPCRLSET